VSTAARKARKRAGEKFEKAPKVGTPVEERAIPQVMKHDRVFGYGAFPSNRAAKKVADRKKLLAGIAAGQTEKEN
jgi:hypothetical protein